MVDSDLDLASDWALVRKARTTPEGEDPSTAEDLESSWRALKNLPETLYQAHKGYAIESMSIYEYECHGQVKTTKTHGIEKDCWRARFVRVVWMGTNASLHDSYAKGAIYCTPKEQMDLTLGAAIARLDKFRQEHLATLRESRIHVERQLLERKKELDRVTSQIATAESTTGEDMVRASLRSKLLGLLQGQINGTNQLRGLLVNALYEKLPVPNGISREQFATILEDSLTKTLASTTVAVAGPTERPTFVVGNADWERRERPRPVYDHGPEQPNYGRGGDGPPAPSCRGCGKMHWGKCTDHAADCPGGGCSGKCVDRFRY